jgi:hypothetical protein
MRAEIKDKLMIGLLETGSTLINYCVDSVGLSILSIAPLSGYPPNNLVQIALADRNSTICPPEAGYAESCMTGCRRRLGDLIDDSSHGDGEGEGETDAEADGDGDGCEVMARRRQPVDLDFNLDLVSSSQVTCRVGQQEDEWQSLRHYAITKT